MLRPGSKIKVLSSSFTKKTGPKKGSIGYVADSKNMFYLPDDGYVVCKMHILFTRYGMEKSPRNEHKTFINMLPVISSPMTENSLTAAIESIIRDFKPSDKLRNKLAQVFPNNGGQVYAGIVAPLKDISDLTECGHTEFESWLESILSNHDTRRALSFVKSSDYMKGVIKDKFITDILCRMVDDKAYRVGIFKSLRNDLILRKSVIDTLVPIRINYTVRQKERARKDTNKWFDEACRTSLKIAKHFRLSQVEDEVLVRTMVKDLYCNYAFLWKKEMLLSTGNGSLNRVAENMDIVRNYLAHLAQVRESDGQ
jgi:hypothetical protein